MTLVFVCRKWMISGILKFYLHRILKNIRCQWNSVLTVLGYTLFWTMLSSELNEVKRSIIPWPPPYEKL